jgi:hypothetical protein
VGDVGCSSREEGDGDQGLVRGWRGGRVREGGGGGGAATAAPADARRA